MSEDVADALVMNHDVPSWKSLVPGFYSAFIYTVHPWPFGLGSTAWPGKILMAESVPVFPVSASVSISLYTVAFLTHFRSLPSL
jgi:hypothetical protein